MPVLANKLQLFIHNTTPYIHPRLDSRIGLRFSNLDIYSRIMFNSCTNLYPGKPYTGNLTKCEGPDEIPQNELFAKREDTCDTLI